MWHSSKYWDSSPWSRRTLNLDKVIKEGVEVELNGHIVDSLSFYFSYAYQDWKSKGPEPEGKELGDRAKHRVNAGLRYTLFEKTLLLVDYKFQDKQISHVNEEDPPESGNWLTYDVPMAAYHVFDFGIEQTLFKEFGFIKDGVLKLYVNNLFDEKYENSRGYPMTDRTYGVALNFEF